jgi:hypothetical protein
MLGYFKVASSMSDWQADERRPNKEEVISLKCSVIILASLFRSAFKDICCLST